MENFYNYVIENFSLSPEAKRILDSLVIWTADHYEVDSGLNDEGIHFLDTVIAENIGMERSEIIKNWR